MKVLWKSALWAAIEHDGYEFIVDITAIRVGEKIIGGYIDKAGEKQIIMRESIYGGHCVTALIEQPITDMSLLEMIAAATAHRACCNCEQDLNNGKLPGYCVVCGVEWPCDTAKRFL